MNKYEYILKSLNFIKVGDSFMLEPNNNVIINRIIRAANTGFTKDAFVEYGEVIVNLIIVKILNNNPIGLNIKIKYGDSNNSEYTMPTEKFDEIFLEVLRENRDKKLNSIL